MTGKAKQIISPARGVFSGIIEEACDNSRMYWDYLVSYDTVKWSGLSYGIYSIENNGCINIVQRTS